jgi:hypothetical protein
MTARPVTARNRASMAEAAWAVALRLKTFGYAEISSELKISVERATEIVRAWATEGAVLDAPASGSRRMYRADGDFVRLAGRTAEDNMWTAMRKLRSFSPSTIAAHATTDEISVTADQAAAYCRVLLAAEYLAVTRRAAPAMNREAIYLLVTETGTKAPLPARVRAMRDPNTGRIIVLEDKA